MRWKRPGPENPPRCDGIGTASGRLLANALDVARAYGPQSRTHPSAAEVVTLVDAYLAGAVLVGLVLNAALGWWWADPLAGFVIVCYGLKEGWEALRYEPAPASGQTLSTPPPDR
jgi:divalent metal cation (Fe/Co/Zn/Cd) transporter